MARKDRERRALIKKLEESAGANVSAACIIGGVIGGIAGATGGGFLAGPMGAVAGAPAGAAIGFHEGCAISAMATLFAETMIGNIPELRRLADEKAMKQKAEGECKGEADNAVSGL